MELQHTQLDVRSTERVTQAIAVEENGDLVFDAVGVDTNPEPNRCGFVFDWDSPSDVDVRAFQDNPVMLLQHDDWSMPIGIWEQVEVTAEEVRLQGRIPDLSEVKSAEQMEERIAPIRAAIRKGLLKAISIGFYMGKSERVEDDHGRTDFVRVKSFELVEGSVVTLGAHQTALIKQGSLDVAATASMSDRLASGREWQTEETGELIRMSLSTPPGSEGEEAESEEDPEIERDVAATLAAGTPDPVIDGVRESLEAQGLAVEAETDDAGITRLYTTQAPEMQQDHDWQAIPWSRHKDEVPKADEDAEWDGSAATKEADADDLKAMSLFEDKENLDIKAGYKGPHHEPDGTVVWRGVAAAMAALMGARGGFEGVSDAEKQDAYEHLTKEYERFDEEPPAFEQGLSHDDLMALHNDGRIIIPGAELPGKQSTEEPAEQPEIGREQQPESAAAEEPQPTVELELTAEVEEQFRGAIRAYLQEHPVAQKLRAAQVNTELQKIKERNRARRE